MNAVKQSMMTGFPAYTGLVDLTAELPSDLITKQVGCLVGLYT